MMLFPYLTEHARADTHTHDPHAHIYMWIHISDIYGHSGHTGTSLLSQRSFFSWPNIRDSVTFHQLKKWITIIRSHCIAPYRIIVSFFTSKKRNAWQVNILPNSSITPRTRTSEALVLFATRLLLVKSSWNDVDDSVKIDDPTLYFTTKPFQPGNMLRKSPTVESIILVMRACRSLCICVCVSL